MSLPKLNTALHTLTLPSTGKEIKFRPFLVKEEKILMMAVESGKSEDMVASLRQIIDSCVQDDLIINDLPMFDIEYIFLQLRARSVGDKLTISYSIPDNPCEKAKAINCEFSVEINVDDIEIEKDETHTDLIDITDDIKVKMRYPKIEMSTHLIGLEGKALVDMTFRMVGNSIEYIMEGEEMHSTTDYTEKEIDEFIQSLSSGQFRDLQTFFNTMPKLRKEVEGVCQSCGKKNTRVLEGMADFFA